MARIIGIDLGAYAVKLAVFQGGFGRFQLQEYRSRVVPQEESAPPDLGTRLEVLAGMMAELPPETRSVAAAGFPSEQASIRLVTLPFGDREKVEATLPNEVENLVPFDLDDMILASRILTVESGASRVLTALAARNRLRPLLAGLSGAKADPRVLVLDADLLGDYAGPGHQAVVDLGHVRTLVALCKDGHALSARAISGGGRDLTLAVMKARGLDYASAEARKHASDIYASEATPQARPIPVEVFQDDAEVTGETTNEVTDGGAVDDGQVMRDALAPLLSELRATLIAFEDAHGVEVDEVVLVGGMAALGGLKEWLEAILGVPVRLATVSPQAAAQGEPGRLALAHAVALKAAGGKGRSLDFRKEEFSFKGDLAYLGTLVKAAAAAAGVLLMMGMGWFAWRYYDLSTDLADLDGQIADTVVATFPEVSRDKVEDPSMALAIMSEKTLETTTRVEALGAIVSETPPTTTLLRAISESVPERSAASLEVSELTISPTNIVMKAETDGFEAAANIESALKRSPRFSQAQKGDEQKRRDKVRFTITIPLEDEEASDAADEG